MEYGFTDEPQKAVQAGPEDGRLRQRLRPALQKGCIVLCDRYADSTIVYQGYGRGLDVETLRQLNDVAIGGLWPDRTLVLDMDPCKALLRARKRNQEQGLSDSEGRFEAESIRFHTSIRQGFLNWTTRNTDRMTVLDATDSPEGLLEQALAAISIQVPLSQSPIPARGEKA